MTKSQEIAASLHNFGLVTMNRWATEGAYHILAQDAEIERLKITQYGSGRLQALRDERDQARDALRELQVQQATSAEGCSVCSEVHAILDADPSKIIRNASDGYPEGRTPRVLTLPERVQALCTYAADWKRWYEEATQPAQQAWKKKLDKI